MKVRFYECEICGQIISVVEDTGVPVVCCGQEMSLIEPCSSDGAHEKHVPVYEVKDGTVHVTVGELPHPMTDQHYIKWILLKTRQGCQRKELAPGDAPEISFAICLEDEVEEVYAYCNIHSLWKVTA